jgi:beta-lactam-binding protein with PASTA domain
VFKFITNRPFWVNLLVAIGLGLLLLFAFLHGLSWITRHGEHLTVPDVNHKNTQEAISLLESQGFNVVIQDSTYTDTLPAGTVIKQLPDPNATVKVNRTVFLTVNCVVPPMVEMPDLKGLGLDFAVEVLRKNHLELDDTILKTDFMKGSVLEQQYNGKRIAKGDKIPWGSGITLVVGAGLGDINIPVPDLMGMTYGEAKTILDSLGISVVPVLDNTVTDTANAFIVKQHPSHLDELNNLVYIKPGMFMDLSLSATNTSGNIDSATNKPNQ